MWTKYPEIYQEMNVVESFVKKHTMSRNRLLSEVTADLIGAGGKRLRPAMVIICSKMGNYNREKAVSLAGALEVLHTATLVHDDIIDRSKLRRGKVTVAEKYGPDMAVYTGDFLFSKAVLMLSKDIGIDKLELVAKSIKAICEGEVDQFEFMFNLNTTVMTYLKRISRKTAVLFAASCGLGAMAADCPYSMYRELARFGLFYGMAFQVRDDLNDFISDAETSGKPVSNDLIKGTVTLPAIYAINKDENLKNAIARLFEKKGNADYRELRQINEMIKEYGGIEYSRKVLDRYIDKGLKALKSVPENSYKPILSDLLIALGH